MSKASYVHEGVSEMAIEETSRLRWSDATGLASFGHQPCGVATEGLDLVRPERYADDRAQRFVVATRSVCFTWNLALVVAMFHVKPGQLPPS
jgi:hypothetical protein